MDNHNRNACKHFQISQLEIKMNTQIDTWFSGLLQAISEEEKWSRIEIIQESEEGNNHWFFHQPFENITETVQTLIEPQEKTSTIVFVSEETSDYISFKKGNEPLQERLWTWSMMGPLDRGFIKHWKQNREKN